MGARGHAGGFVLNGSAIVPEKSDASCALASQGEWLCLAWTGTDSRLNTIWSQGGRHFTGQQRLDHRSYRTETRTTSANVSARVSVGDSTTETISMPPALAWTSAGTCLAWTGTDRRLNVWNLHGGPNAHVILRETSTDAPCIADTGAQILLAWIGTDRRLNVSHGSSGSHGAVNPAGSVSPPVQVPGATSWCSPAICPLPSGSMTTAPAPDVAVAWTGSDRKLNVSVGHAGAFGPPITLDDTSHDGPTLCAIGQELVLAWQGTDRRLNAMSWPLAQVGHRPARRARLGATSSHRPALTEYRGQLLIAWTGTDFRPNVARLSPA